MTDTNTNTAVRNDREMERRQLAAVGRTAFPRAARLLKPVEFKRVFNNPVVSTDRFFKVLGRSNEISCSRLGMAVSRQVDKSAVGRNRIKRVVRESFRHSCLISSTIVAESIPNTEPGKPGSPSTDLVVLPRRESATICKRKLFLSLDKHWIRIKDALERQRGTAERNSP